MTYNFFLITQTGNSEKVKSTRTEQKPGNANKDDTTFIIPKQQKTNSG